MSLHLSRLTGFMLLGFVAVMGANLMESLYISQVGTLELAALGFTFPLVMMMQGVTMGLGVGASSVVARKIGAHDWTDAKRLMSHAIWMVIGFTVALSFLVYWSLEPIFGLLGADQAAAELAIQYMSLWLIGLPFFAVAMVGSSLMRAAGDAIKPSYLMTFSAVIQIVLGPRLYTGATESNRRLDDAKSPARRYPRASLATMEANSLADPALPSLGAVRLK